jgi:hypothetical protein
MKLNRIFFAMLLALSVTALATAQAPAKQHRRPGVVAASNSQALASLQKDLIAAIQSMSQALPIYDGNRVRSIHAAHRALVVVDHAILGANATQRQKPTVHDNVQFKQAHTKYTSQQIAQSQANMEQGLAALNQAMKDFQAAVGSTPNKAGTKVAGHLQTSMSEANKAISMHTQA